MLPTAPPPLPPPGCHTGLRPLEMSEGQIAPLVQTSLRSAHWPDAVGVGLNEKEAGKLRTLPPLSTLMIAVALIVCVHARGVFVVLVVGVVGWFFCVWRVFGV